MKTLTNSRFLAVARAVATGVGLIGCLMNQSTIAAPNTLRLVDTSDCMPLRQDHTHMWWADGFPGHVPGATWLRCVQTGHYAMVLDTQHMRIPHFGASHDTAGYAGAAVTDNALWRALPPADLALNITVDGKEYRCIGGGRHGRHVGPRLIASGRFVQCADVTDLGFRAEDGSALAVDARLETTAWPDRLALLLEARPKLLPIVAGPTFGQVGGGYGFSGKNDFETSYTPELDPAEFTLAFWVYPPSDYRATRHYPWLICKGGNEWIDGHFGIALREGGRTASNQGVPWAFLNIGGGKDNTHVVSAVRQGQYDLGLETEEWHHMAMSYDGQVMRLYVDGKPAGSTVVGKTRQPVPGSIAFARRQDGSADGYRFRGVLDEVRLYRRALTDDVIEALATAPENSPSDDGLVREWSFDPRGQSQPDRPGAKWKDASIAVRLCAAEHVFEQSVRPEADTPWTPERPARAAIVVPLPFPESTATESEIRISATDMANGGALPVAFLPDLACHRIDLDPVAQQGEHNDRIERVRLHLANATTAEYPARLLFAKTRHMSITGISAIIRDTAGDPTGIPVQISKNWHRAGDLRLEHEGPWFHGFSVVRLPARSQVEFELTLAYAHWGGVAAASHAQLCLIGWGSNQLWDQSAIGSWGESICYEPDRAQADALITDVRPLMVNGMRSDEPRQWVWTNNVGGGDTFRLFDMGGKWASPERMKTVYHRQGPCLTEVTYAGELAGGVIRHQTTVSLSRSDDITRGFYRLRMDVADPVEFSRFVILQIGADTYSYTGERKMAIGNEDGLTREWPAQWGGNSYRTERLECAGRVPWISLHEAVSRDASKAGAWANRGLIVREWRARLGGADAVPWAAEHGVKARGKNTSTIDILSPDGVTRLMPGDYVEAVFEHVVVPQQADEYYGPNANLRAALRQHENTWRMIHREAAGNDRRIDVVTGELRGSFPAVRIDAVDNRAEFAITGGLGYVPLTICGLRTHRAPRLHVRTPGGGWQIVDQSVHGHDFWQTDYIAESATWEVTFNVRCDTPGDRPLRREYRFESLEPAR